MKQAIFQVLKLKYQGNVTEAQHHALCEISEIANKTLQQGEGFEELGEYTWLCLLETSLPSLSGMIYFADRAGLPYRITYLDNELEWINFNPERS